MELALKNAEEKRKDTLVQILLRICDLHNYEKILAQKWIRSSVFEEKKLKEPHYNWV